MIENRKGAIRIKVPKSQAKVVNVEQMKILEIEAAAKYFC
jgi:hypothetical protein